MWNYWGRILNEVKKRERGMVGGKKKSFLDDLKTSKSSKR